MLCGELGVGRVIARPFEGKAPDFKRTADRRDFSLGPPTLLLPEAVSLAGKDCYAVGKINDIFGGKGFTKSIYTHSNAEGMALTSELADNDFCGLCFVNLVDFDMLWGHRRDVSAYADGLSSFDAWLGGFLPKLGEDDALFITADHGCDPADDSTDHTREYVPFLMYGKEIPSKNLGTILGFDHISNTVCQLLNVK